MKFISKSSNLLIVLRPGMSAQPLTGSPAVPTISVRFKDGVADLEQQEMIDLMLAHPGFNNDFISSDNVAVDPYSSTRQAGEPAHEVTDLKYGTPVKHAIKGGDKPKLSPEMQKMVQAAAVELAKTMLPTMVEDTLKKLVSTNKTAKGSTKKRRKPSRKPSVTPKVTPETATEVVIDETPEVKEEVVIETATV